MRNSVPSPADPAAFAAVRAADMPVDARTASAAPALAQTVRPRSPANGSPASSSGRPEPSAVADVTTGGSPSPSVSSRPCDADGPPAATPTTRVLARKRMWRDYIDKVNSDAPAGLPAVPAPEPSAVAAVTTGSSSPPPSVSSSPRDADGPPEATPTTRVPARKRMWRDYYDQAEFGAAPAGPPAVAAPAESSAGSNDREAMHTPTHAAPVKTKRPISPTASNSPTSKQPSTKVARTSAHVRAPGTGTAGANVSFGPVPASSSRPGSTASAVAPKLSPPAARLRVAAPSRALAATRTRKDTARPSLVKSAVSSASTPVQSRAASVKPVVSTSSSPSLLPDSAGGIRSSLKKPQSPHASPVAPSTGSVPPASLRETSRTASLRVKDEKVGSSGSASVSLRPTDDSIDNSGRQPRRTGMTPSIIPLKVATQPTTMDVDNRDNNAECKNVCSAPSTKKDTLTASADFIEEQPDNCNVMLETLSSRESGHGALKKAENVKSTSNESGLPERGDRFEGFVETSTRGGHRVFAQIRGQRMVGWVIPVNSSAANVDSSESDLGEFLFPPALDECEGNVRSRDGMLWRGSVSEDEKDEESGSSLDAVRASPSPRTVLASNVPRRSVVIVGAGIAGIAAARVLKDKGFHVVVLEARGRLGGRIATDWSMGSPVELGACFIHGSFGNPLALVAREAGMRTYVPSDVDNLFYSNGVRVSSAEDEEAEEIWRAMTNRAERLAENVLQKRARDMSLGALLRKLSKTLQHRSSKQVEQLLSWHASNLEMACAADLDDLSAIHYDMDVNYGFSGPHEIVRDGYSSIVHALAQNVDVRLNTVVKAVYNECTVTHNDPPTHKDIDFLAKYINEPQRRSAQARVNGGGDGVVDAKEKTGSGTTKQVRYLDKASNGRSVEGRSQWFGWVDTPTASNSAVRVVTEDGLDFAAEWCIITVPLGVLQSGDIKFDPPLPRWKQESVERIGFGVVNKVVLRFDSAFWVREDGRPAGATNGASGDGTKISDTSDDDGTDYIGRVADKHGVFTMFLSMVRVTGAPILVGITAGKFAEFVEGRGDDEVAGMAVEALTAMYGPERVGRLVDWRVTRWASDRFSRGSYSYARVGSTPTDYLRMATPVERVLFAGEATYRKHPATAHGAFMSGVREASRIIRGFQYFRGVTMSQRRALIEELALMEEPHAPPASPTNAPKKRNSRTSWRR